MPTCEGFTATHRAPRYLSQLRKHLTNRGMQVDSHDETHVVANFGFGTCTLQAKPDGLAISLATPEPAALERAQRALTRDIERFGRRDKLTITWHPSTHH